MDATKRKQYLDRLKELNNDGDTEGNHCYADYILCEILNELGYSDIVDAWQEIDKWYA